MYQEHVDVVQVEVGKASLHCRYNVLPPVIVGPELYINQVQLLHIDNESTSNELNTETPVRTY